MADVNEHAAPAGSVETTDRGLFDFMKKKEETEHQKPQEEVFASEFDQKMNVSEPESVKKEVHHPKEHETLLERFHRSDNINSSSSDEEGDEEEKKKRKKERKEKKGLKDKLEEKLPGHKDEEDTNVPIEKYEEKEKFHAEENVYSEPSHPAVPAHEQEKKGLLGKIKDKLPGHQKEEHHETAAPMAAAAEPFAEGEKKGFMEKIKDKIPGLHSKTDEEKREIAEEKKEVHY